MSTVRVQKTENYSIIANQPINDKGLSWGARGLLAYLLSKPNDWQVRMSDLESQSPAGAHATRTLVKELETAGYMTRKRYQDEDGKFTWQTTVFEQRQTIPQFSIDGKSIDGSSIDGKVPDILNTESPSTDLPSIQSPPVPKSKAQKSKPLPDWNNLQFSEAIKLPEIALFRKVTGRIPGTPQYPIIFDIIHKHAFNEEYLTKFWRAWVTNGYRPENLNWLVDWAVNDYIPSRKKQPTTSTPPTSKPTPSSYPPAWTPEEFEAAMAVAGTGV